MKKTILSACFMLLILPLAASAYSFKKGDSVYVSKDETIEGSLYAVGSNLIIEGKITGDVICAGQSININGEVAGDVICAGESVNVSGPVGGNLRLAGSSVNFNGQVARNAMLLGATVITTASSTVGWDLLILGNAFELNGNIGRDLYGSANKVSLSGQISQEVDLKLNSRNGYAEPLIITGTAKINGQLKYKSAKDAAIDSKANIKGEVIHNFPATTKTKSRLADLAWWLKKLISLFSALVIGLVLISLGRESVIKITDLMLDKTGLAFGWGILALLLPPLLAIILAITIIGLPLSLIFLALWLIALYVSKTLVGILVGRSLMNNFWPAQKDSLILAMIIGMVIAYLIFALPLVGKLAALLAMLWGLGGIMLKLKNK